MALAKASVLLAAVAAISAQIPAARAACEPSAGLAYVCGLINAEDLVRVPGTSWIVASGLADGQQASGHLYLVSARDRSMMVLLPGHVAYRPDRKAFRDCPRKPDEAKFSAHGLSLRPGEGGVHTLYVVHHGERESVEVFKLKAQAAAPTLTWIGCVVYPVGASGNGVAALPRGAFAASSFMDPRDPKAVDKLIAGEPMGGMLLWWPGRGWQTMAGAKAISADNGVEATRDGKQIFVAGTGDETVVRLSLGGKGGEPRVIRTGFHTDNLRWGSDGFLYASGARATVPDLFSCAPTTQKRCTSAFSVLRIDPRTLAAEEVLHHPGAADFGAASTALRVGDEFWLGTPHGDRIAIAPAK